MARRKTRRRLEPVEPDPNGYARVLVATDFSPRAEQALWRAVRLPLPRGAVLFVLHVAPRELPLDEAEVERAAMRAVDRVEDRVRELAAQVGRTDLEVRAELARGAPSQEIARVSRADRVELCVVGRHGAGGFSEALLGSTAERLARESRVPLLIVSSAHGGRYQRPLIALDFDPSGARVLREGLRMAPASGEQVRLVHAYPISYGPVLRYLKPSSGMVKSYEAKIRDAAMHRARVFLRRWHEAGHRFELVLRPLDPRQAILDAAKQAHADLIVVGTAGRRGMSRLVVGSVAAAVLRSAPTDVLVVRARPGERAQHLVQRTTVAARNAERAAETLLQ